MKFRTLLTILLITGSVLLFDLIVNNYLLFHIIAEFFSISILFTLFTITWNAKDHLNNRYLLFIGIGGLFIGVLDLLHTLTYKGMNIIPSDRYYANQFWIATRLFESIIILSGFLFVAKKIRISVSWLLVIYSIVTTGITLSILYFKIFPACFVENVGQTPFKIYSEYVIISILIAALGVLKWKENYFEKEIHQLILWSIIFAIISEFCFTLYIGNYDYINKVGHIFKIVSFYLIYKANIQSGFKKPIETFFHDLKISQEKNIEYNKELEKQIATKNRFFSILSHDLRNPFTVLLGFTEYLLDNDKNIKEEERKNIIKMIYETADETYRLLENLLSWSRTQTNTISYNPVVFDIGGILNESSELISRQAALKEITLIKDYSPASVIADIDMIKTVIRNLLSNAVKFTHKSGTVKIKTRKEENFLAIEIIDTGIGIPGEKLESLFHTDINHSTKGTADEPGTGLGLMLSAEFIKINKGQFYIESEVNKGSTFTFTLPLMN
ncbi:MAG TPA: MASE3 domain-containing protein [Bacteroidales bacterium]|nr:MASE3 domain-containing protein [Bacteroidales bacterium]